MRIFYFTNLQSSVLLVNTKLVVSCKYGNSWCTNIVPLPQAAVFPDVAVATDASTINKSESVIAASNSVVVEPTVTKLPQ